MVPFGLQKVAGNVVEGNDCAVKEDYKRADQPKGRWEVLQICHPLSPPRFLKSFLLLLKSQFLLRLVLNCDNMEGWSST